ncbi:MAG: hypothetical protein M0R51_16375 [Clostridia bacterium]|jgi:hypothetical protein|nr:hypothetical protein [Clostridia bacterium]
MDFMNLQQFVIAVGYVSQDLIPHESDNNKYMFFGLTSRKYNGMSTYLRCRISGELVDQFASQHTKGSIVMVYGDICHQYDQGAHNRVNNLIEVKGWFYFADIDAHFDDLSDIEYAYLVDRLKAFRTASNGDKNKIIKKLRFNSPSESGD